MKTARRTSDYIATMDTVLRTLSVLAPMGVGLYALLMAYGYVPSDHLASYSLLMATALGYLASGVVWCVMWRNQNTVVRATHLLAQHVCMALFLVYVSGFDEPPLFVWLFLMMATHYFFGRVALIMSTTALFAVALLSVAATPHMASFQELSDNLLFAGMMVIAGFAVTTVWESEKLQHDNLEDLERHESVEKSQLVTLLNSVNDAIISINAQGRVQIYNAAALSILDTNGSLAGKHIDTICKVVLEDKPLSIYNEVATQKRTIVRDDLEMVYPDGERVSLGISSSPVWTSTRGKNTVSGYILAIRDITRTKSLEEERDEFISVVSHELRTPITIAEGTLSNAQLIFDRGAGSAQIAPLIKNSHDQILYLASMVNDLSTLSRAERGVADTPETIEVAELLHSLYAEYLPKAKDKGLALDLDVAPKLGSVQASRLYLEEILQNFLTNAIKYTAEGKVTLRAELDGVRVRFAVADTGIGISKGDQKRVFEKFFRSEDYRTRVSSGTGLGLYVVKKLSHKLGTTIELKSRLNHGSEFAFALPIAEVQHHTAVAAEEAASLT